MARSSSGTAPERPSEGSLKTLRDVIEFEAKGSFLPIRRAFLQRDAPDDPQPPLAALLPRAGLDAVQLKTLLLVLRMAAFQTGHQAPYDAQVYAKALDLPEPHPGGRGDKRVREAVRRLEEKDLLVAQRTVGGRRIHIAPLRDDGSGEPYTNPSGLQYGPDRYRAEGHFFGVPDGLFTHGWLAALSASALTVLLILRHEGEEEGNRVYLAPSQRHDRHAISDDTWQRGTRELVLHRLAATSDRKTKVGDGPFDFERRQTIILTRFGRSLHSSTPKRSFYVEARG